MTDLGRLATAYGVRAKVYAQVLDPTLSPVHERLLDLGDVGPATRLLDVATGPGAVARRAAERGAQVTAVDISAGMVEYARSVSPSALRFEVADVGALPFEDSSFDVVTCGFGLSHFPDVPRALAEIRRVLVPGGRFVESSWGREGSNPAFSAVLQALKQLAYGGLHSLVLDEDRWADTARGLAGLTDAGFGQVSATMEPLRGAYTDAAAAVRWTLAWPDYGETFDRLAEADRSRFREDALASVAAAGDLRWWFAINYYAALAGPAAH